MSYWTYISGVITVTPMGRTQAEMRYILDTILDHLPRVTGSEEDMHVHVIPRAGHNSSSSHDEFGMSVSYKYPWSHWNEQQTEYLLVLEASLRDREFDETLREFNKWLNRLAKRCWVRDIAVKVTGYDKVFVLQIQNRIVRWKKCRLGQRIATADPAGASILCGNRLRIRGIR